MPVDHDNRDVSGRVTKFFMIIATLSQLSDFASDALLAWACARLWPTHGYVQVVVGTFGFVFLVVLMVTAYVGVRRLRALGLRLPWPILILSPFQSHVVSAFFSLRIQNSGQWAGTEVLLSSALSS